MCCCCNMGTGKLTSMYVPVRCSHTGPAGMRCACTVSAYMSCTSPTCSCCNCPSCLTACVVRHDHPRRPCRCTHVTAGRCDRMVAISRCLRTTLLRRRSCNVACIVRLVMKCRPGEMSASWKGSVKSRSTASSSSGSGCCAV
jgi:hypothetical protein